MDENGEVIIAEAVCYRFGVFLECCCLFNLIAVFTFCICFPFLCLGFFCSRRAASSWRLYLTSTGLHYTSIGLTGRQKYLFIPLGDIQEVIVQNTVRVNDRRAVSQTQNLQIVISRDKTEQYIPWIQRTLCFKDFLNFNVIQNATGFSEAVNKQKQDAIANSRLII